MFFCLLIVFICWKSISSVVSDFLCCWYFCFLIYSLWKKTIFFCVFIKHLSEKGQQTEKGEARDNDGWVFKLWILLISLGVSIDEP